MKIATFNSNSIRARLPIIQSWLEQEQPDILCIQETKVQDKDFPENEFRDIGYHVSIRGQKSYNGVALISKSPLTNLRTNLYEKDEEEARFISARVRDIPVINVYVPQGYAVGTEKFEYKLRWLRDLLSFIGSEYDPKLPLIVVGDFNVALKPEDVYDPDHFRGEVGFHPDEQTLIMEYVEWGLVDVFRKHNPEGSHFTFWDYRIPNALKRKKGWRIDYILATPILAEKSLKSWVDAEPRTRSKPSDHTFLVAEFNLD